MESLASWLGKSTPKWRKQWMNAPLHRRSEGTECRLIRISDITWNQTGKSIAISCNSEHDSWCHHAGNVAIFTLNR
ncbi:unnamed protein product [Acanthoscelides obtectus]|uniref:Uncharacterized protein n=2 Tax=Acanthoscelides obtectus TaxID=200917 RepID=A0A9P0QH44_ACAOB|nr:unnamed protein product [Acanthoscelides obtectus]